MYRFCLAVVDKTNTLQSDIVLCITQGRWHSSFNTYWTLTHCL